MRSVRLRAVVFNKSLLLDVLILMSWSGLGMCSTECMRDWKRIRRNGAHPFSPSPPPPQSRAKAQIPDSCALLCRDYYSGYLFIGAFRWVGEITWESMFKNCYDIGDSALCNVWCTCWGENRAVKGVETWVRMLTLPLLGRLPDLSTACFF